MKLAKFANIALALALTSGVAFAKNEVVVSTQKAAGTKVVAGIDFVSDGKVAAFDFDLMVPGLDVKSVNLANCASELPKGFRGWCNAVQDKIVVLVVGDGLEDVLPAGVVPVGKISFSVRSSNMRKLSNADVTEADGPISVGRVSVSDGVGKSSQATGKALAE